MPHIHLLIGIIFINILPSLFSSTFDECLLFLIGSVVIDIDFLFWENHRSSPIHSPLLNFACFLVLTLFRTPFALFFLGTFIHTIVDGIDWQIKPLWPIMKFKFSVLNLNYKSLESDGSLKNLIKNYYKDRRIIIIEIIIFLIGLFSSLFNL